MVAEDVGGKEAQKDDEEMAGRSKMVRRMERKMGNDHNEHHSNTML